VWRVVFGGLVLVLVGARLGAATNPFTGTTLERSDAAPVARAPLLVGVERTLLRLQRALNRGIGRHLRAIRDGESPRTLLVGLAFSFLYGVLHTLGPGHGKVVVVSYFLSRNARLWRGLRMGIQIAITHVLSAVALCWLADLSLMTLLGDSSGAVRGIQLASYGTTAGVGGLMLVRAVRRALRRQTARAPEQEHRHADESQHLGALSVCVGLVPCTGAVLIMLFALANDMLVTGTLLVVAIAAGMAVTMSALGMVGIVSRAAVVSRWPTGGHGPSAAVLALEVGGALTIAVLSAVLFVGSLLA
jgi:ABC-type nickel/cobalt efflux system permease component RcnA